MTTWTSDELSRIEAANELEIAPLRGDGTLRKPTPIWVVRHGDDLYVRSYRGAGSSRFRAAQASGEGHIRSGGVDKDVTFAQETDPGINNRIDALYRSKYRSYGGTYVDPMVADQARGATLKLAPR
jgi:hypothetical protein